MSSERYIMAYNDSFIGNDTNISPYLRILMVVGLSASFAGMAME